MLSSTLSRRLTLLRNVLLIAAVLVGIATIVVALMLTDTDDPDVAVTGNAAVDKLIPSRDDEVLSQETVGVDLAIGYDARLALNGVDIPPEQVRHMPNINLFTFRPDQGKVVERLRAERNCVQVTYWLLEAGPEQAETISWCFNAS